MRERGRLLGKYGQSEARLRRRDGGGAVAESPGDDDGAGADRVRRGRRRGLDGVEDGGADLERRQIGVGNALSSRTTATTGTAFSTAGFGTATSGSESDSESSTSTGTRTAPTRIPTQSSSVGEVHLVNYDADLCVALSLVTPRSDRLLTNLRTVPQVLLRAHRDRCACSVHELHPRHGVSLFCPPAAFPLHWD